MPIENLDNELSKLRISKSKKSKSRGKLGRVLFILLLLGGGSAAGFFYYAKANAAILVKVVKIQRDSPAVAAQGSAILTAGGYVIPRDKVEVSSKIVGRVKEIYIERGDLVKQGDLLIEIEDDEYDAQVKVAEARVESLKARLSELRSGSRPQEIAAAKASVASAEATLAAAKSDYERMQKLAAERVASPQELDRMRQSYDVARANLDSTRKNSELVEIGPRKEIIRAAEAQLREAEANLSYAKTQHDFTVMRAPITGTILEKIAEKGELVTNTNFGGTRGAKSSVVSMANLEDLQVELDINENDLPKVKMGQKTEIRLDSNPSELFHGEVDEISPQADRQKATVQVKVKILDPRGLVRPEVNARVTFMEEEGPKKDPAEMAAEMPKLWIPRNAIVSGADGALVYIATTGKTAVARKVKPGKEGPRGVEITEGLTGNESLIIEPLEKMADGVKIAVAS